MYLLLLFVLSSCARQFAYTDIACASQNLPPGCVKISDNFFVDKAEIANIDYREYMFYLEVVEGQQTWALGLPDTSAWPDNEAYFQMSDNSVSYPDIDDLPIVGLTMEQVRNYIRWRNDRVAEIILLTEGIIMPPTNFLEDPFTLEKYESGNYPYVLKNIDVAVPEYRLPTEEEWQRIAKANISKRTYDTSSISDGFRNIASYRVLKGQKVYEGTYEQATHLTKGAAIRKTMNKRHKKCKN